MSYLNKITEEKPEEEFVLISKKEIQEAIETIEESTKLIIKQAEDIKELQKQIAYLSRRLMEKRMPKN